MKVVKLQDNRPSGPVSKDYFEKHIAENIAKGSALCPFGSTFMKDSKKENDIEKVRKNDKVRC